MDTLIPDVLNLIMKRLSNKDKARFLSITSYHDKLRGICIYDELISYEKIKNLSYKMKFTSMSINIGSSYVVSLIFDLQKNIFHTGLKHIKFCSYKSSLNRIPSDMRYVDFRGYIPNTVTKLSFESIQSPHIVQFVSPYVTKITMDHNMLTPIYIHRPEKRHKLASLADSTHLLPPNVKYIVLKTNDLKGIKPHIPSTVTCLKIDGDNSKTLTGLKKDFVPDFVTHLKFGYWFNRPIDNIFINTNITHLIFGASFNQKIIGYIPNTVIYLAFGSHFNQDITNAIPDNVKYLILGNGFRRNIVSLEHTKVEYLTISRYHSHFKFESLFDTNRESCILYNRINVTFI